MTQDRKTDHIANSPFDDVLTAPLRIPHPSVAGARPQIPTQRTAAPQQPGPVPPLSPAPMLPPQVNGSATAGFVLGIVAAVFSFIPFAGTVSWVLAPIALVLSVVGLRRSDRAGNGRTMSIAGIVLAVVALVLCILYAALLIGAVHSVDRQNVPVNHTTTYAVTTPQ